MNEKQAVAYFLETGTAEAFCVMFGAVYHRVRRYFVFCGLEEMTAEDLAQNVLLKVYRHAGALREPPTFYAWVFKIARNELISYRRKPEARVEIIELDAFTDEQLNLTMAATEPLSGNQLMGWLAELETKERELLVLRFIEGLSYEELAVALELPLGTVKSRLFHARSRLAQVIETSHPHLTRSGKRN